MSIAERLRYFATDDLKAMADDVERLEHAVTYALNAIDEHMVGAAIDWYDVRRVLARALGEAS